MNTQGQPKQDQPTHLLDAIRTIRANLGDSLNDNELTRFLRESALPTEVGFTFLSFSEGFVTFTVPKQDSADWYVEQGWIASEKEKIARAIAEKYGFSLFQPVDATLSFQNSKADVSAAHHHLELIDQRQTVIVAHPQYLKVCLFGKSPDHRYVWQPLCLLTLGPDLLQDLSLLYRRKSEPDRESTSNQFPNTETL